METLTEALTTPFQYAFMIRALIIAITVGIMCPIAGIYVVTRGLGFMSDGLAHSVLPGIVAAAIIGVVLYLGAIPMAIFMALTGGWLIKRANLPEDTSIGILFAALFAAGIIMISIAADQGVNIQVNIEDILLGNILGVSQNEMYAALAVAAAVLLTLAALHKELIFANFDPTGASVAGLPTDKLEYLLLTILALVIVIALQAIGVILVISLLITPAAAALQITRSVPTAMIAAALLGVASGIAGLYLSYYFNLPSGPVMALVAFTLFILTLAWKQTTTTITQRRQTA